MQGASPVTSQYLPDPLTPEPQQLSGPRPYAAPDAEQPEPAHWPHSAGQQMTSPALMPAMPSVHIWAVGLEKRNDDDAGERFGILHFVSHGSYQ